MQERRVLESWKEISDYLRRSIKTCQRWEIELSLPIHRLDGTPSARVFAYPDELDHWVKEKLHSREAKASEPTFVLRLKKKKTVVIATALVVLAVIAFLAWQHFLHPPVSFPTSTLAGVAFLPFENVTGDETLEPWRTALPHLFYIEFLQSMVVGVSDPGVGLKKLGLLEAKRFSVEDIKKIAESIGGEFIATGSLIKSSQEIIVNLDLHDQKTGEVIQSFRAICRNERAIFDEVDGLTKKVKVAMGVPPRLVSRDIDDEISQITTDSPEALKLYCQGMRMLRENMIGEALSQFEKATEIDSEFSEAYYQLFLANKTRYDRSGDKEAKKDAIRYGEKAFASIDRLNAWTRGSLITYYLLEFQTNFPLAVAEFRKLLAIRAGDPIIMLQLAQIYSALEEYDKAIALLENESAKQDSRNIQLLANSYLWTGKCDKAERILDDYLSKNAKVSSSFLHNRELYALSQGKFDEALAYNDRRLAMYRRSPPFIQLTKAPIFITQDDFENAERELRNFLDQENLVEVFNGYCHLTGMSVTQGKLEEARSLAGLAAEKARNIIDWNFRKRSHLLMANLLRLSGNLSEAMLEAEEACPCYAEDDYLLNPETKATIFNDYDDISCLPYFHQRALITLEMGRIEEFEKQLAEIKELIEGSQYPKLMRAYYHLLGHRELRERNFDKAVNHFWKAVNLLPFSKALRLFPALPGGQGHDIDSAQYFYSLGEAYYQAGKFWSALDLYKKIPPYWEQRVNSGDIYARSFYRMAKIYDQCPRPSGTSEDQLKADRTLAVENYRKFLSLWKEADPIFAVEVEDARQRLAALEAE